MRGATLEALPDADWDVDMQYERPARMWSMRRSAG
jgi:hypothetical protein